MLRKPYCHHRRGIPGVDHYQIGILGHSADIDVLKGSFPRRHYLSISVSPSRRYDADLARTCLRYPLAPRPRPAPRRRPQAD
jgi:hypothetical protein